MAKTQQILLNMINTNIWAQKNNKYSCFVIVIESKGVNVYHFREPLQEEQFLQCLLDQEMNRNLKKKKNIGSLWNLKSH